MGRPRIHDREKLAIDLLEWAKKEDSTNLNKFCALNDIEPSMITRWVKEDDSFRRAYEISKAHLAARREEMLSANTLHVKAYDLNATVYDHFMKDEKKQQAEFEHNLAQQARDTASEEQKQGLSKFVEFLDSQRKK